MTSNQDPFSNNDSTSTNDTMGSRPDNTGNGTPKQKLKEDVQEVKHEAGAQVREKAEAGQHRIADEADALSSAIDAAASKLDEQDREGLARYARELSGNLADAAGQLEARSVDELANDAKRLARNNPALFMLGSIAVGFGLSRFFKASAEHDHSSNNTLRDNNFGVKNNTTGKPLHQRDRDMAETYTNSNVTHNGDGREML